jgi:hypothetical protein
VVSSTVALAAFGGFVYYALKVKNLNKDCEIRMGGDKDNPNDYTKGDGQKCIDDGAKFDKRNKIAGYTAAAVGGIALFAIYKGFIATKESPTQTTSGRSTRKKKQFAVTPIVSPEGGGATFRLDW